jgi:hypothetical protein
MNETESPVEVNPWTFECPKDWEVLRPWGDGYAMRQKRGGLRAIVDCERKADGEYWIHVSVSRKDWNPSHDDMCLVKQAFLGDRYAYAVYPPQDNYVNIHAHCLHLWARFDGKPVLPEFSDVLPGVGLSI